MTEKELVERLRINLHTKEERLEKEIEIMKKAAEELSNL